MDRIKKQYEKTMDFCNLNKYDLLTPINELQNCYSKVKYNCPKHGIHETTLLALTQGHGCSQCQYEENAQKSRLPIENIISLFEEYGSELINPEDYKGVTYKNLQAKCPCCEELFVTSAYAFQKHDGQLCQKCAQIESKGEFSVRMFLENNNIDYIPQYRFKDCKYKNTLPFDFYLINENTAIEYDGEYHYFPISKNLYSYEQAIKNFHDTQIRDSIKTKYCTDNGIKLIRIPYWDYKNIDSILTQQLLNK